MPGMKERTELQQLFSRLTAVLPREAGPETEQRLLSAFRTRKRRTRQAWSYWGTAAASFTLVLAWFLANHFGRVHHANTPESGIYSRVTAGFIPLPYSQSDVPLEQMVVVRVNLRASDWDALGAPLSLGRPSNTVRADLLVGQDGVARAVRLVNVP